MKTLAIAVLPLATFFIGFSLNGAPRSAAATAATVAALAVLFAQALWNRSRRSA
jgi:hypothetical protein